MKPRICITMGDPAGIGPEIVSKLFLRASLYTSVVPVVVGDYEVLRASIKKLKLKLNIQPVGPDFNLIAKPGVLPVCDLKQVSIKKLKPGRVLKMAGQAAYSYTIKAVSLAQDHTVDAIVTAPINKAALHRAGHNYNGHTEILAKACKTDDYAMVMAGKAIKVLLVTTHCGVSQVVKKLSINSVYKAIRLGEIALRQLGVKGGRIAVLSLNPHGGESGIFGTEEKNVIAPAIHKAVRSGMNVQGPLAPDTAFIPENRRKYDIFVCMYHDQGLIPFKMLEFETGVNVTVGLPIIRTSVDHGTAFDIAGQGKASDRSLWEAVKMAAAMSRNRFRQ